MNKNILTYVVIIVVSFTIGFVTVYNLLAPNETRSATVVSMQKKGS